VTFVPNSWHAMGLAQTSVAFMAMSSVLVMVVLRQKRDVRILSQTQEELLLIAALGLFWLATLVGFRAYGRRLISPARAGEVDLAFATAYAGIRGSREPGFTAGRRPYPCSGDDIDCIVEEWTFF